MAHFGKDLARGKEAEARVASVLGATLGGIPLHNGDMQVQRADGPIDIEVKFDERAKETGNVCFELYDLSKDDIVKMTGVAKHATQPGHRLVVHQVGTDDHWLVYEPVTMLRELHRWKSAEARRVKPWNNGHGKTWGVLHKHDAAHLPATRIALDQLPALISAWVFEGKVIPAHLVAGTVAYLDASTATNGKRFDVKK